MHAAEIDAARKWSTVISDAVKLDVRRPGRHLSHSYRSHAAPCYIEHVDVDVGVVRQGNSNVRFRRERVGIVGREHAGRHQWRISYAGRNHSLCAYRQRIDIVGRSASKVLPGNENAVDLGDDARTRLSVGSSTHRYPVQ